MWQILVYFAEFLQTNRIKTYKKDENSTHYQGLAS